MERLDLSASFYGGRGFTLYHARGRNSAVPLSPHFHDEYLICAQLSGHEHCHVAGKLHQFSAGDIALINPQQVHTGNTDGQAGIEYVSLYISRDVVRELASELETSSASPEFTVVRASKQQALVDEMMRLLAAARTSRETLLYPTSATPVEADVEIAGPAAAPTIEQVSAALDVEAALHRVVLHAFEEFSNMRSPHLLSTHRIAHRKIARALEYMRDAAETHDPATFRLDSIAEAADLSKFHFLRQFTHVVGMTPGAYLRTLRLCQAARMLRTTERPILEIALAVGFADHPSFSRAFARHMGMTPREYQRLGPL